MLYLPFVVVVAGFLLPDNKLHFVKRCSIRYLCSVSKHTHAHTYKVETAVPIFYAFVIVFFIIIFLFLFLHFMFCWQLNGAGRFHGLASLDDITAIISTPPLGGFQVVTAASPIWCLNKIKLSNKMILSLAIFTDAQICRLCYKSNMQLLLPRVFAKQDKAWIVEWTLHPKTTNTYYFSLTCSAIYPFRISKLYFAVEMSTFSTVWWNYMIVIYIWNSTVMSLSRSQTLLLKLIRRPWCQQFHVVVFFVLFF